MMFKATDEEMKEYCAIIQNITYLDIQKEALLKQLEEWENKHKIEE